MVVRVDAVGSGTAIYAYQVVVHVSGPLLGFIYMYIVLSPVIFLLNFLSGWPDWPIASYITIAIYTGSFSKFEF